MKSQLVSCILTLVITGRLAAGWSSATEAGILGLTLRDASPTGAQVTDVTIVSPGIQAGVLVKDVIKEVDGQPVRGAAACMNEIFNRLGFQHRESVVLTIERSGRRISAVLHQLQSYDNGFDPKPLQFPAVYRDYQVLPGTISPEGQYAFIYPKRSRLYLMKEYGLFLATPVRFHVSARIPLGNSNLAGNARCYYAANWAKNSSSAVFISGSRWGPEKVTVVRIRNGAVVKQNDLIAAVRNAVRQDFRKSHAKPYNDYYDFVFDSEDRQILVDDAVVAERGWDPDSAGHVKIDCTCTTDPKHLDPHDWAVHFKGVWNIQSGRFRSKEFTRIEARPE